MLSQQYNIQGSVTDTCPDRTALHEQYMYLLVQSIKYYQKLAIGHRDWGWGVISQAVHTSNGLENKAYHLPSRNDDRLGYGRYVSTGQEELREAESIKSSGVIFLLGSCLGKPVARYCRKRPNVVRTDFKIFLSRESTWGGVAGEMSVLIWASAAAGIGEEAGGTAAGASGSTSW